MWQNIALKSTQFAKVKRHHETTLHFTSQLMRQFSNTLDSKDQGRDQWQNRFKKINIVQQSHKFGQVKESKHFIDQEAHNYMQEDSTKAKFKKSPIENKMKKLRNEIKSIEQSSTSVSNKKIYDQMLEMPATSLRLTNPVQLKNLLKEFSTDLKLLDLATSGIPPITLAKNMTYLGLTLFKSDPQEFMKVKNELFKVLEQAVLLELEDWCAPKSEDVFFLEACCQLIEWINKQELENPGDKEQLIPLMRSLHLAIIDNLQYLQTYTLSWQMLGHLVLNQSKLLDSKNKKNYQLQKELERIILKPTVSEGLRVKQMELMLDVPLSFETLDENGAPIIKHANADNFIVYAVSEAFFNLGTCRHLLPQQMLYIDLQLFFLKNIDKFFTDQHKIPIVRIVWGLSRLGLITSDMYKALQDVFLNKIPHMIQRFFNAKDIQTLLEALAQQVKVIDYDPTFLDVLVERFMKMFDPSKGRHIKIVHSLIKSLTDSRYDKPEIFAFLTSYILDEIKKGTQDEMLVIYAINRFAKNDNRKEFIELFTVAKERKLFQNLKESQNMVLILHAMTLQEYYDIDLWKSLLSQILMNDDFGDKKQTSYSFNEIFHRTLFISTEIFEIDNPEILEKDKQLAKLFDQCKAIIQKDRLVDNQKQILARSNKFFYLTLQNIYQNVHLEQKVGILSSDLYIEDIDMIVEINGPVHYKVRTNEPLPKEHQARKLLTQHHKYLLQVPYVVYQNLCDENNNDDFEKGTKVIKKLIDKEIEISNAKGSRVSRSNRDKVVIQAQ